jgi:hypothetical protein
VSSARRAFDLNCLASPVGSVESRPLAHEASDHSTFPAVLFQAQALAVERVSILIALAARSAGLGGVLARILMDLASSSRDRRLAASAVLDLPPSGQVRARPAS